MKYLKYTLFLFVASLAGLTSCTDELISMESDVPVSALDEYADEYTLNLAVTLDAMGAESRADNPMYEIENYIDPEKIRVLFFDHEDKFLFESKSRRVKKLGSASDYSEWLVSVPFYSSGNDVEYNWDWDAIRESLTSNKFKIAILANRPLVECYPDLTKVGNSAKNFDNSGPHWTRDDMGKKRVFDLHHSQWDPIYTDKGKRVNGTIEGYYEFIMGVNPNESSYDKKLMMSSTSCWVDHGPTLTDDGVKDEFDRRYWIMPSQDYPIPMYGIQEFEAVSNWQKGMPFNLSDLTKDGKNDYDYKAISLLRSVVKLELLIPTSYGKPTYIGHKYPNIYARCEPMDVWTPTDKIWKDDHDNDCEWKNIFKYGAFSRKGDPQGTTQATTATNPSDNDSFIAYRKRISWLYGAWLDKYDDGTPRWSFGTYGTANVGVDNVDNLPYPRIYNPVVQRNQAVRCGAASDLSSHFSDGYYHFVVYTGERNVNDPSDLFTMGTTSAQNGGNGKAPTISWVFNTGNSKTTYYNLPIGPSCMNYYSSDTFSTGTEPNNNLTYEYHKKVWASPKDQSVLPWPLVRNHVYRITVTKATKAGDANILSFKSECLSTPDIRHY